MGCYFLIAYYVASHFVLFVYWLVGPFVTLFLFSRGHATLHLAVSVGRLVCRSVGPSVRPSVTLLNSERFSHYCSCPTVRDWIAVYPALFLFNPVTMTIELPYPLGLFALLVLSRHTLPLHLVLCIVRVCAN